jgi:hypothetical protein
MGAMETESMEVDGIDIDNKCTDTVCKGMFLWLSNYKYGHPEL